VAEALDKSQPGQMAPQTQAAVVVEAGILQAAMVVLVL
jgi:hypothetical protein